MYLSQAERLGRNFKEVLEGYGERELPMKEMVGKLMMDATKDDESLLPHIYSPETEYCLSSIFVDAERPLVNPYTVSSISLNSFPFHYSITNHKSTLLKLF